MHIVTTYGTCRDKTKEISDYVGLVAMNSPISSMSKNVLLLIFVTSNERITE